MTTYIALLRGINVGAHNRMKMAELRELCESFGLENVQTYIQSGNVVFETSERDGSVLESELADTIRDRFGYDISVMVRTRAEFDNIVERQPFDEPTDENTTRYVTFLREGLDDDQIQAMLSAENDAEAFAAHGREVYSRIHRDKLKSGRFTDVGKLVGVPATRRNWNVVTKVHALLE
ncbi:DUF1697 domain-containing protein [Haladaptatus sp. DFWS20]|uniref:DUF1697 domain-containing protein n=1 Tax=Haladaptatus sp. DFWS20 TaxID=3403467 RepID=UPI003EB87C69